MRTMAICANCRELTSARAARRLLAVALLLCLMLPGRALAGPILDRAVSCLETKPVCVDPAVKHEFSQSEADALTQRIESEHAGPMYVAVLPEVAKSEAGGAAGGVLAALHDRLQMGGTYAVVAGGTFKAASTRIRAIPIANAVVAAHQGDGVDAVLTYFVDRVGEAQSGRGAGGGADPGPSGSSPAADDGGSSGTVLLAGLGILGLGGAAVALNGRRQRRRREERELAEVKTVARDDLVALGDDIRALDLDVEIPGADP